MSKAKIWVAMLVCTILLMIGYALAEGPISAAIALDPEMMTEPGTVNVTITIQNTGSDEVPVELYSPAGVLVDTFGEGGSCTLQGGEKKTWSGKYEVKQQSFENGAITYSLRYPVKDEDGNSSQTKTLLRAEIIKQGVKEGISVVPTYSTTVAANGDKVEITYTITNVGTVTVNDISIKENKSVSTKAKSVSKLEPGKSVPITYTVTMGKKDITSQGTITYKIEGSNKKQSYTVDSKTIRYGKSDLSATLSSSSKGVTQGDTVTLTLKLTNNGTFAYTDIHVTDSVLGEMFADKLNGSKLSAGKSLTVTQEVPVSATANYQMNITLSDDSGKEESLVSNAVTVEAMDPSLVLHLQVNVTADRTEVFENPAKVRFTIEIVNDSNTDATGLILKHGSTEICSLGDLKAGMTRKISRDTAPSMSGKYQFTVSAKDSMENRLSFESNIIQVFFSVPTPVPATSTPRPVPTAEPVFIPATIPPKTDPSIGATPRAIQKILKPLMWVFAGLLAGCIGLVIASLISKWKKQLAEKNAIATLTIVPKRNYTLPVEEKESKPDNTAEPEESYTVASEISDNASVYRDDEDFVSREAPAEYDDRDYTPPARSENSQKSADNDVNTEDFMQINPRSYSQETVPGSTVPPVERFSKPIWTESSQTAASSDIDDGLDSNKPAETPHRRRRTQA